MGFELPALVAALNTFMLRDFIPVWGTPCKLRIAEDGKIPAGEWAIVFLDDADIASALGYHDLTPDGFPLSKVFVRIAHKAKKPLSITVSHELVEMVVDPAIQLAAFGPNNTWYALEVSDACQEEHYVVDGFQMTDFMYPSWFEGFRKTGKFDHLERIKQPFEILKGGYMPIFRRGRWSQIFGSRDAEKEYREAEHPRTVARKNVNYDQGEG